MQFEYTALGLLALVAVETSILLWKSPRKMPTQRTDNPIFVDTSVLMDGRITGIAASGFITSPLVVPRSVLLELQLLADKSDHDKRERARFGLDVVAELQATEGITVSIFDDGKATNGVDERLLELAKTRGGSVLTIDYNLNKVASVEHVKVLNINELAQGLRMAHLPGEKFSLELVEKGSDSHQAVGYLHDGTMVVVENAAAKLGKTLTVECIRSLQTVAGKMLFARLLAEDGGKQPKSSGRKSVSNTSVKEEVKPMNNQPTDAQNADKANAPKRQNQNQQHRPKQHDKPAGAKRAPQPNPTSSRPKTSKQREASLIRSIESQQD